MVEKQKFGHNLSNWELAKTQAIAAMAARAKVRGMITYSDLVTAITAIKFNAHDKVFHDLLGEASVEENASGRGMISAIVVHKNGDLEPGKGFYGLAESLDKDVSDQLKFWVAEIHIVHKFWSNK